MGLPAQSANAKSGPLKLADYLEYLADKDVKGIITASTLYQGADRVVLLKRLQEADRGLQEIPVLANNKEWSQIQTLLVGPLETMTEQLDQIASTTSNSSDTKKQKLLQAASSRLKIDLIDIRRASAKLNAKACTAKAAGASKDLVRFLAIAFEQ